MAPTPETVKAAEPNRLDAIRHKVGLPLALVLFAAIWLTPRPEGLTVEGQKALALFGAIFVLYVTEAMPLAVSSLLVVPAAVFMGVANVNVALGGFASSSTYLILGAFILAAGMVKTRLAERITYMVLARIGCSPKRITFGVMMANIILAFLVPSTTARTAILIPVCLGILNLFKSNGTSKFAVNLLLTLAFTNMTISAGILTATVPNPLTIDLISRAGGPLISYTDWLVMGFPPALLLTLFTWWFIQKVNTPEKNLAAEGVDAMIRANLARMGPMSSPEWRALGVFILVVALWATQNLTRFDTTVVCLLGVCLLFLPKFGVLVWDDANKGVSWQVVLIAGGGVSLGDILMRTGAAKWMAATVFHTLGLAGASALTVLIIVMFIVQYFHLMFSTTAAMTTALLPIVLALGQTAHIDPRVLALPAGMIIGGYPLLMFYNTLPSILVYGTGKLQVADFPRVGVVICSVACIVYALCAATYWHWLGFL